MKSHDICTLSLIPPQACLIRKVYHQYIHTQTTQPTHTSYIYKHAGRPIRLLFSIGTRNRIFLVFFSISRVSRQSGYGEADLGSRSYSTFLSNLSVGSKLEVFHHHDSTCCFSHTCTQQNICGKVMRVKFCCSVVGLGDNFISSVLASFFSSQLLINMYPYYCTVFYKGCHDVVNICYMCVNYYRIHR